ncbi:4-(cytidine 5'-diphospho)-2-C-methyl-D-erythritol kinase [Algoriphagus machipongonensis]|uniref:4-diphosphocytidyl-2-C-methyl-D-erythritol kinase n=1 Tax=Algoriphagus machipongonensis TaxID=388413 RepID=A3I2D0_9BACT|nr:4-(cytidine 5'-diphospho)-2-C-methyl-D-erythritol kinase [Algoriphagus machipongonensis]EAZ79534.1 4-(cytidine 5'-diphospho)-2-C-methyl-D-erythritol kinase [Algoriphagus machipongonensis]
MICFPNAKINLGLQITSKRSDGFHNIESCFYPIPLFDALEIITHPKKSIFQSTGLPIPGDQKDNLINKAYQLLKKDFPNLPQVQIHLHKNIPMGAGLGGGSADAAFALNTMNNLFDLILDDFFLEEYALKLGSDCPFFIENKPKIATGRGEILEDIAINLEGKYLLLINPGIHIGTKEAYAGIKPKKSEIALKEVLKDTSRWKAELKNDFEPSIFENHPEIAEVKNQLYQMGAFYASMSGSGSTVFGLFEQKPEKIKWNSSYFQFIARL